MEPSTSSLAELILRKSLPCVHAVVGKTQMRKTSCENVGKPVSVAKLRLVGTNLMSKTFSGGDHMGTCLPCGMMEHGGLDEWKRMCDYQEKNACYESCGEEAYGVGWSCRDSMIDLLGRSRDPYCLIAGPREWSVL